NQTIFFLYKGALIHDSRSHFGLSHSMALATTNHDRFSVRTGEELRIRLRISNTGFAHWLNENIHQIGVVLIGTHLYNEAHQLLNLDFSRHVIKNPIAPSETFEQDIYLRFDDVGQFHVSVDLVSEMICWFENTGSKPLHLQIDVHP
ncbi:MAG: hypothetical protein QG599_640, partial [Pseudomonadota bacterium]|nr:hypothetical protein [Pseudomonadota bacterium]